MSKYSTFTWKLNKKLKCIFNSTLLTFLSVDFYVWTRKLKLKVPSIEQNKLRKKIPIRSKVIEFWPLSREIDHCATIKQGLKLAAELENYFVANDTDAERLRMSQKELSLCMLRYKELHRNLLGPKRSIQTKLTEYMVQTQSEMLSQSEHHSIVFTIDSDTNSSNISAGHQNKRLRIID